MTILEHPLTKYLWPFFHVGESDRGNIDLLDLPDQFLILALGVKINCNSCGAVISPFRKRVQSERARIAGAPEERRLFYSGTCPSEVNKGCSRTTAAGEHKEFLLRMLRK